MLAKIATIFKDGNIYNIEAQVIKWSGKQNLKNVEYQKSASNSSFFLLNFLILPIRHSKTRWVLF